MDDGKVTSILLIVLAAVATFMASPSPSFALPDGRVYELISPAEKNGAIGGVLPLGSVSFSLQQFGRSLQSSLDGHAIDYAGEDFYRASYGGIDQYLSQSDSAGWTTQNLTPFTPEFTSEAKYAGFSPNLSVGIVGYGFPGFPLTEEAPAGYANLYLLHGMGFQPLLTVGSEQFHRTPEAFGYAYENQHSEHRLLFAGANAGTGSSEAFSHILFEANDALTTNAIDGGRYENNLYEWSNGRLRLVNVLPGSVADPSGEAAPNASFGIDNNDEYNNTALPSLSNVISADGSRIFWTDQNNGGLYVRENGERTTLIAEGGEFQTASSDGSRVLFSKEGHLYEYNLGSGITTDLAPAGGVLGLAGTSANGAYVYFAATSALAAGAVEGKPNLYLSHAGQTNLVARLSPADDETPNIYGTNTHEGDWWRTFAGRTSEVSPSGRYIAFIARENLTGYETIDANTGARDYEVFVYDAAAGGGLACASCNINGTPPTGRTLLPAPVNGVYQQRYMDDSGRLFFSTADPVLPEDTNGTSDVYEYEEGHVSLISPGNTPAEAVFADASESGNDVFFTTRQQLVPADRDQIIDLYDARVGGRSEVESPASPCSAEASEEACRESAVGPPSFGAPSSTVFSGSGNAVPPSPTSVKPEPKPRTLTRAQKLSKALRACRAMRNRHRRMGCEVRARRRYR